MLTFTWHTPTNEQFFFIDYKASSNPLIMDSSIFPDSAVTPDDDLLKAAIGDLFQLWVEIREYVQDKYPAAAEKWNFPGRKYGWSYQIRDKKRAILYLLPRDKYFQIALVFGERAVKDALNSEISLEIKENIESARVYAEGRGFRIEVRNNKDIQDIKKLVDIKLLY